MYSMTSTTPGAMINVGISWRALNGQRDVPQKEKVYTMHVEKPSGRLHESKTVFEGYCPKETMALRS